MPSSRLEIFPDAGHFPHHADPERFVALLGDFIDTTEPATHDPAVWRGLLRREAVVEAADLVVVADDDADLPLASGT